MNLYRGDVLNDDSGIRLRVHQDSFDTELYIDRIDGCRWFRAVEMLPYVFMETDGSNVGCKDTIPRL